MVDLDDFQRRVSHVARGCPTAVLRDVILQAAEDFCERTWIWVDQVGPMDGVADQTSYRMPAPSGAAILALSKMLVDSESVGFVSSARDTAVLHQATTGGETILGVAALKPIRTARNLPDFLYTQWQDAIASGARAKLLSMGGAEWFQPQLADRERLEFERHWVPRARVEIAHRQGRPLAVSKKRFI
jgi:hypothetical protein